MVGELWRTSFRIPACFSLTKLNRVEYRDVYYVGSVSGDTSIEVGVSEEQVIVITGPELLCEVDTVVFEANFPGFWSSDCFGCIDSDRGVQPIRSRSEHLDHLVHADSYCPVGDEIQVEVNERDHRGVERSKFTL